MSETDYRRIDDRRGQIVDRHREEPILDASSQLWRSLSDAGAELVGDRSLFPYVTPEGVVGRVTYRVRRGFIDNPELDLGGFTLADAVAAGAEHPFWAEVGLAGPPEFWGAAALVLIGDRVLIGEKRAETDEGVESTFGGTSTVPAGIVDVGDFRAGEPLSRAFVRAAIRELEEETGLSATPDDVEEIRVYLERPRVKQQAFVRFALTSADWRGRAEVSENEFHSLRLVRFSREALKALELLSDTP